MQGKILGEFERVLDFVPTLEHKGECEQAEDEPAVLARTFMVETQEQVRRHQQPDVQGVIREVDRLDIDDAYRVGGPRPRSAAAEMPTVSASATRNVAGLGCAKGSRRSNA